MPDVCFIIAPISTPTAVAELYGDDQHCINVVNHLLVPAAEAAGFEPVPPLAQGADVIHAEIVRQLETSALVLCDMSTLNPNVFFELGIRTAVNKPVSLVRDAHTPRIPFDTGIVNAHTYDGSLSVMVNDEEVAKLSTHLRASFERSNGGNGLWRYFGLSSRGSFVDADSATSEEKIDLLLAEVSKLVRNASPTRRPDGMSNLASTLLATSTPQGITHQRLREALDGLPAIERAIIELRFGLDGYSGLRTLEEVSEDLGMTREMVRRSEARGLRELHRILGTSGADNES